MILYEVQIDYNKIRKKEYVKECPKSYKIFISFGLYCLVPKQGTNKYKIVAQNSYNTYFITYEDAENYCKIKKEEREQRATIKREEQEYLKHREKVIAKAKIDGAKEFAEECKNRINADYVDGKLNNHKGYLTENDIEELLKEYENE